MKIVTWNVNSIRARIDNIVKYLKSSSPDIALLQEIKTEQHSYPFDILDKLGTYPMLMVKKAIMAYQFYRKKNWIQLIKFYQEIK